MKNIDTHEPLSIGATPATTPDTHDGLRPATLQAVAANMEQFFTYRLASATELRVALGGLQALLQRHIPSMGKYIQTHIHDDGSYSVGILQFDSIQFLETLAVMYSSKTARYAAEGYLEEAQQAMPDYRRFAVHGYKAYGDIMPNVLPGKLQYLNAVAIPHKNMPDVPHH